MAPKPTPSSLADSYKTYDTASAAAIDALRGIKERNLETGGGILYNAEQQKYAYTQPVGQSDGSHFSAAVRVPPGWKIASTYHTHPDGPQSTLFSDDDINTASQLKVPSYILAQQDNKIRSFDPASSKISKSFNGIRSSLGSTVNETPPAPVAPAATPAATPPADTAATASASTVPVTGSKITMADFASQHRARTTKYRHKIINIGVPGKRR